jgi:hypothetical protein
MPGYGDHKPLAAHCFAHATRAADMHAGSDHDGSDHDGIVQRYGATHCAAHSLPRRNADSVHRLRGGYPQRTN